MLCIVRDQTDRLQCLPDVIYAPVKPKNQLRFLKLYLLRFGFVAVPEYFVNSRAVFGFKEQPSYLDRLGCLGLTVLVDDLNFTDLLVRLYLFVANQLL